MSIEQITAAMERTHDRNHSIIGAILVYLHSTADDPFERVAAVNHAVDAALNLAMMLTPGAQRDETKKQIAARILDINTEVYPEPQELLEKEAFTDLFKTGVEAIVNEPRLMNIIAARLVANAPSGVNDTLN